MWFGTRNGLNRYDGKNFKLFTKQKDGLAENKIIQLAKDNHNHLFIVYGNPGYARSAMRMEVMDLSNYKLKSLKETFPTLPFNEDYVYWIANGGDDLCFLVSNPFRYWRLTSKGFEMRCEMKAWDVSGFNNQYWLTVNGPPHTTWGPYCQFYEDCALLKLSDKFPQYFCTPKITTVFSGPDSTLINPRKQLTFSWDNVYHTLSGNFSHVLIYRDKDGLFLYDFTSLHKLLAPEELHISGGYGLYSYFIDKQNNIWICTAGGLIKVKREKNLFTHYFTKEQLKDSSENQVRGIYVDEAENVYSSVWTKFCRNNGYENKFSQIGPNNIIYGLCRCMNKIYIGESKIFLYEPGTEEGLKRLTNGNVKEIWSLDSLSPGKLLAGCTEAILTFDIGTNEFKPLIYLSGDIPKAQFVYRFIRRKDKKIWAVAQNGLYVLDENGDSVVDYFGKTSKNTSHRLPFDILLDGYEDDTGIFWFATNGEGLFRWNRNKNARLPDEQPFRQFNSADGLPSDILYRIESDDYGNLWISTDNGLARFNTKNFKSRTYTTKDGISHNEFNRTSSFKADDGRLFFGGLNGVNAFYPKDFISDSTVSQTPIHLISFNKFSANENKLVDQTNELLAQNKIVLLPGDRFFNLEFQLLDFEEGNLNYAYMIKGIDKDWNYISENSIRISGLPYGEYTLYVKGQSHNGQWSKSELKIPLVVFRPFYFQWWFIVLTSVALVFLFILVYKWRVKQLINAKLKLEKEVLNRTKDLKESLAQEEILLAQQQTLLKEKDVLLKEIHHRVKNNLQVISGLLELQEKNLSDDRAKQALQEGRTRVRSIALIHQNLYQYENLSRIELCSFTNDLYKQVSAMFENKSKDTTAKINIPVMEIDIDTAVPFGLAVNELLTNSFKYGHTTDNSFTIEMTLTSEKYDGEEGNKYIFVYSDTGPGLPAGFDIKKSKSLGMRLVNDLSKQMGGSMRYTFEKGSRFTILFSDKKARKKND
jgi:two-component sensor histidine kinase